MAQLIKIVIEPKQMEKCVEGVKQVNRNVSTVTDNAIYLREETFLRSLERQNNDCMHSTKTN